MPRFVVHYHKTDRSHYDLMLERGGELVTFSVYHPLNFSARDSYSAELKDPHPLAFLEYEGPLAKEGGSVTMWDSGTYAAGSWKKLDIRVKLHGRKLKGSFRIHCESELGRYFITVVRPGEAESDRPKGESTTSRLSWRGKMFEVYEEESVHDGKKLRWEVLRKRAAVAVVPLTGDGRVILVRQFRYPLLKYIWEIPAGHVEDDEDLADTAKRELAEETGYFADDIEPVGTIVTMPGVCNEKVYIFKAAAGRQSARRPEEHEIISDVKTFSAEEVFSMIERGEIVDSKTIVGLYRVLK